MVLFTHTAFRIFFEIDVKIKIQFTFINIARYEGGCQILTRSIATLNLSKMHIKIFHVNERVIRHRYIMNFCIKNTM